jgi:hypothetical protein
MLLRPRLLAVINYVGAAQISTRTLCSQMAAKARTAAALLQFGLLPLPFRPPGVCRGCADGLQSRADTAREQGFSQSNNGLLGTDCCRVREGMDHLCPRFAQSISGGTSTWLSGTDSIRLSCSGFHILLRVSIQRPLQGLQAKSARPSSSEQFLMSISRRTTHRGRLLQGCASSKE